MRHALFILPAIALSGATLMSQAQPAPRPAQPPRPAAAAPARDTVRGGFSVQRLERIDALLQQYVDENRIGGAAALVLRDGKPVYEKAVGWADKEANRRMTTDTIFRIASQTKAITSVGVLALVEEGKIGINDPVSRFIPAYAKTTVAVAGENGQATTVPARRQITIRDLLTHTAGISYGTDRLIAPQYEAKGLGPAAGFGWYTADKSEGGLRHDGAPRVPSLLGSARRALGLRLQHRHPRMRDREGVRHAARRLPEDADPGSARHAGYVVLPAGREAQPPGSGLLEQQRRPRAAPRKARAARATTSTARGAASPAAPDCCPRRATTRGSWK